MKCPECNGTQKEQHPGRFSTGVCRVCEPWKYISPGNIPDNVVVRRNKGGSIVLTTQNRIEVEA